MGSGSLGFLVHCCIEKGNGLGLPLAWCFVAMGSTGGVKESICAPRMLHTLLLWCIYLKCLGVPNWPVQRAGALVVNTAA